MVNWKILYNKKTILHIEKLKRAGFSEKTKKVVQSIQEDPFNPSHCFEKLVGNLKGYYSKRINIKHRIVYSVDIETQTIFIYTYVMWSHYES